MANAIIRSRGFWIAIVAPATLFAAPAYLAQVSVVPDGGTRSDDGGADSTFAFGAAFSPIFVSFAPGIVISGDTFGLGRAGVSAGSVGVYSRAAQGLQGGTTLYYANVIQSTSRARFTLDDVVVTHLVPGPPPPFVNMALRFVVHGRMAAPVGQGSINDTATRNDFPDDIFGSLLSDLALQVQLRAPVPLPSTAWLLGSACVAALGRHLRTRRVETR